MGNLNATFTYTQYTGTNTVKIAIYKDSDPNTEVAAVYKAGPFTDNIFYFTGLDRVAYRVKRFEVENANHTHILADYGVFFVFIPNNQRIEYKAPVTWTAGMTLMADGVTVFPSGVSSFTNSDWAGWEAALFHQFGSIFMRGRDYSYDASAGTLAKLQAGDIFEDATPYEMQFQPKISTGADDLPGADFTGKRYITANDSITSADLGKDLIVRGTTSYIVIQLPKLTDVQELKRFYAEMPPSNTVRCAKFVAQSGDKIDFGKGNKTAIRLYPTEAFEFFKETNDTDTSNPISYWRVKNAQGNHLIVGETVSDERDASHVINKTEKIGSALDADVYGRLYEDHVLDLPSSQVVPFNQWSNGENRYKYSLKDSITNTFHIPDTRGQFERQSSALRPACSFQANVLKDHTHATNTGELPPDVSKTGTTPFPLKSGKYYGTEVLKRDLTSTAWVQIGVLWVQQSPSNETAPDNVANNRWIRI